MIALYFYRARQPAAGPHMDLRDSSCRPDPDFDALTLGLCRPGLRQKVARIRDSADEPIEVLFYTKLHRADAILLVALLRLSKVFRTHADALPAFGEKPPPPNLLVDSGSPCRLGSTVDLATLTVTRRRAVRLCACERYATPAQTPYLVFDAENAKLRLRDPVEVRFDELPRVLPKYIGRRWPTGVDPVRFQHSVQNGCHWICNPGDVASLRNRFQNG